MKDIIELAKKAGLRNVFGVSDFVYAENLERFAALVRAEYEKSLKLAEEALIYHTQQTRPIQKTDEAIIYLQNVLNKQEQNMTFTLEDAIKKFPEIAYWNSEFEKHNTTATQVDAKAITDEHERQRKAAGRYEDGYTQGRAEALEEAAEVGDSMDPLQDGAIAAAIRGLK